MTGAACQVRSARGGSGVLVGDGPGVAVNVGDEVAVGITIVTAGCGLAVWVIVALDVCCAGVAVTHAESDKDPIKRSVIILIQPGILIEDGCAFIRQSFMMNYSIIGG
jgi:hypothetical protein